MLARRQGGFVSNQNPAGGPYWSGSIFSCRLVRGFLELFLQVFVGFSEFSASFVAFLVIPLAESGVDLTTFAGADVPSRSQVGDE